MRFVRFNIVGIAGFGLQLGVLWVLADGLGVHYLAATAAAVETAVLHNYLWHRVWTWGDRKVDSLPAEFRRLGRFHLANALVSISGNLTLMYLFVAQLGVPLLPANILAVGVCALVNFLLGDRFVFATAHDNS